jgi:polyisoprenoid-binding protein YceI
MKRSLFRVALPVSLLVLAAAAADAKLTATGGTAVEFKATGPAGLAINGKSNVVQVADDDKNITVTVPLNTLDTGIGLRNSHMKDKYLETGKYPNAVLVVPKSSVGFPNPGSKETTGNLTLHGVTKAAPFHYDVKKENGDFVVNGTVKIKLSDYKIAQPSFAGATVKDDVDVTIAFRARE